ncbi:unnamed protein product [Gadus morhua 'NCC']
MMPLDSEMDGRAAHCRLVDLMLCSQTSGSGAMVQAVPGASRPVRYDAQPGSPGGSARKDDSELRVRQGKRPTTG